MTASWTTTRDPRAPGPGRRGRRCGRPGPRRSRPARGARDRRQPGPAPPGRRRPLPVRDGRPSERGGPRDRDARAGDRRVRRRGDPARGVARRPRHRQHRRVHRPRLRARRLRPRRARGPARRQRQPRRRRLPRDRRGRESPASGSARGPPSAPAPPWSPTCPPASPPSACRRARCRGDRARPRHRRLGAVADPVPRTAARGDGRARPRGHRDRGRRRRRDPGGAGRDGGGVRGPRARARRARPARRRARRWRRWSGGCGRSGPTSSSATPSSRWCGAGSPVGSPACPAGSRWSPAWATRSRARTSCAGGCSPARSAALYRLGLAGCEAVFFQNPDDRADFERLGLLPRRARIEIVRGSGVDVDHYAPEPLPGDAPVFVFVGRLLREKGILDYVEAARRVRARHPDARFLVVGGLDPNPASVTPRPGRAVDARRRHRVDRRGPRRPARTWRRPRSWSCPATARARRARCSRR